MVRSISESRPISGSILPCLRLLVEVDAVVGQRVLAAAASAASPPSPAPPRGWRASPAPGGPALRPGALAMPWADEVHRVEPRHVLQLQEVDRVALALGEQGDQHVGARHLVAAGGLHMDGGALDHALEAGGRLRVAGTFRDQPGQVLVEELGEVALQLLDIDAAGPSTVARRRRRSVRAGGARGSRIRAGVHSRGRGRGGASARGCVTACAERSQIQAPAPKALGEHGRFPESRQWAIMSLTRTGAAAVMRDSRLVSSSRCGIALKPVFRPSGDHSFSIVHCRGCWFCRARSITWVTLVSATS